MTDSMASRTTICSFEVSGSVCTRTVDVPVPVLFDATTTGLEAASISVPTTASVTSVDLVARVVGDGLELHATLELDAVVEPTADQADGRERDDAPRRSVYQRFQLADEVDGLLTGVELLLRVC